MNNFPLLLAVFFAVTCSVNAQQQGESKYGIDVKFQATKLDSKKKKDKYLLEAEATNNSGKDLYYTYDGNDPASSSYFAEVKILNTKGVFANTRAAIIGDKTKFKTTTGASVFKVENGKTYKQEINFPVDKGNKPVLRNEFPIELVDKSAIQFDYVTEGFLEGQWVSDCGNFEFFLDFQLQGADTIMLTQRVNGREFIYDYQGNNYFIRRDNAAYNLNYAADGANLFYNAEDGVSCTWKRKEE